MSVRPRIAVVGPGPVVHDWIRRQPSGRQPDYVGVWSSVDLLGLRPTGYEILEGASRELVARVVSSLVGVAGEEEGGPGPTMSPTVGLDPGTATGVARFLAGRVQVETWRLSGRKRWATLFDGLEVIRPRLLVVEDARGASFQRNRGNAARIFQASFHAIVEYYVARHPACGLELVPPATLKKYATGRGGADKPAMVAAAVAHLGLEAPSADEADAAWLLRRGLEVRHGLEPMATVRAGRAPAIPGFRP